MAIEQIEFPHNANLRAVIGQDAAGCWHWVLYDTFTWLADGIEPNERQAREQCEAAASERPNGEAEKPRWAIRNIVGWLLVVAALVALFAWFAPQLKCEFLSMSVEQRWRFCQGSAGAAECMSITAPNCPGWINPWKEVKAGFQ